jgi:gamma-glutamylcysteine synthetase
MGTEAKRVMFTGNEKYPSMVIEFSGDRQAQIAHFTQSSFSLNIGYANGSSKQVEIKSNFFELFIKELINYFKTGKIPVQHKQTLAVIAIRAAGIKAMSNPFTWVDV